MSKKEGLSFIYVFSIMRNTIESNESRLNYYLDLKPQKIVSDWFIWTSDFGNVKGRSNGKEVEEQWMRRIREMWGEIVFIIEHVIVYP